MANLQSELQKIAPALTNINFADDEADSVTKPEVTVSAEGVVFNITRAAFEYIKANPGRTVAELNAHFGRDISARVHAMFRRGQLTRTPDQANGSYRYRVAVDSYSVMSLHEALQLAQKVRRDKIEKRRAKQASQDSRRAKAAPQTTPKPAATAVSDVDSVLNSLTVAQARALYTRLKELFGA